MDEGSRFAVPEPVRRRVLSEGAASEIWLATLEETMLGLEQDWSLSIGPALESASAGYVAEARNPRRDAFIIKVSTPATAQSRHEADVLLRADGKGYARLLRHDLDRHAMLLEKLGPNLDTIDLPYGQKIDIMCATLLEAWMPVPLGGRYPTGAEKANALASAILAMWERAGQPCAFAVIETALRYCHERAALYRVEASVLAHGDPRPANTLVVPGTDPVRFKLVDPDGLSIEPAHDLGLLLCTWNEGLEGRNAHNMARGRVRQLTQRSQVPAEAIWQWAYIERVSTGLRLLEMGEAEKGQEFLRVAEALLVI